MRRSKAFGPTAVTAATKTTVGSAYTLPAGVTKLTKLYASVTTLTKAESIQGYITLEGDWGKGPFEYTVPIQFMSGTSGTEAAWGAIACCEGIPLDIPVPGAGILTVSATITNAVEVCVSVEFI